MDLKQCKQVLDNIFVTTMTEAINPNYIFESSMEGNDETCHYPLLLQAIVRQNVWAVKRLLEMGANPYSHFYITDQSQNCVHAISARDMAYRIYRNGFDYTAGEIYRAMELALEEKLHKA